MKHIFIVLFLISTIGCSDSGNDTDLGYYIFKNTPIEKLAKALDKDNIKELRNLLNQKTFDLNYQEENKELAISSDSVDKEGNAFYDFHTLE